jgi:hypothetical protein
MVIGVTKQANWGRKVRVSISMEWLGKTSLIRWD